MDASPPSPQPILEGAHSSLIERLSAEQQRRLFSPWSLLVLILLVWGQSLAFDFVWDDRPFITENTAIQELKSVPGIFWRLDAQSSMPEGFVLFRPLRTLHYSALYFVAGGKFLPALYHLANLLWHSAAVLLLFRLLRELFPAKGLEGVNPVAWAGAAAFAVHPVASEVVCWVKSLDDLMATTFVLAASLSLVKQRMGLTLLWFILALYSKESAVPFVTVVFLAFGARGSWKAAVVKTAPFVGAAFVYVLHRHFVIGRTTQTTPISGSYGQTLLDTLQVVPEYFRLLFGVPPFVADYSWMRGGLTLASPPILLGLLLLASSIALAIWLARRNHTLAALGLAWLGLFLLPVSNLLPMMQYMADRFLYLPLVGWIVFLVALWFRPPLLRARLPIFGALIVVWAILAAVRATVWRDELTLFATTYAQGYAPPRVEQNAIAAVFQQPEVRAIFEFNKQTKKARLLRKPSREEAVLAIRALSRGAEIVSASPDISAALGIILATTGNTKGAIEQFQTATRLKPEDPAFWANLGQAYIDDQQLAAAHPPLDRALELNPNYTEAWRSKSQAYWLQEDYAQAIIALKKLRELEPNNPAHQQWITEGEKLINSGRP